MARRSRRRSRRSRRSRRRGRRGAGAQDDFTEAHEGDYRVSMSAAYVDDRQAAGFNASATNYNKYIIGIFLNMVIV